MMEYAFPVLVALALGSVLWTVAFRCGRKFGENRVFQEWKRSIIVKADSPWHPDNYEMRRELARAEGKIK